LKSPFSNLQQGNEKKRGQRVKSRKKNKSAQETHLLITSSVRAIRRGCVTS
jgi:hypothetical protein